MQNLSNSVIADSKNNYVCMYIMLLCYVLYVSEQTGLDFRIPIVGHLEYSVWSTHRNLGNHFVLFKLVGQKLLTALILCPEGQQEYFNEC